ncbi:MAG: S41 family peptidase, partial [Bacteroides sp.]|nr:S41 family peptidase [Bacteroides sp.]MCM1472351.1 S41 family peptidase [Bacteroides sp.]
KFLNNALIAIIMATICFGLASCSDNDDEPPMSIEGNGVSGQSWGVSEYNAPVDGETITFTFTAADGWTATSSQSWAKLINKNGRDGRSELSVEIAPNTTDSKRSAIITIQVLGAKKTATIQIVQATNAETEKDPTANFSEVNRWTYNYMKDYYLWNEPIPSLSLSGKASYDKFFESILTKIDAMDHMNRDDGHWENGVRDGFYSYIDRSSAGRSRAFGEKTTGSGIEYMAATYAPGSNSNVVLLIAIVVPDSPADKLGIKRGDMVSQIDGTNITASNYSSMANKLVNGGCKVTIAKPNYNSNGEMTSVTNQTPVQLSKSTFEDPAIYVSKVVTASNGKKVGYINYMYFDLDYDSELINVFRDFKSKGVEELILDLRYNGGGHVVSSTVLGSLISGGVNKGKVYNHTTYNAARTAAGEDGYYKLGVAQTPDGDYTPIATAAATSLDLNRIFVLTTVNTASASELVINGLRGLDVTVNLIGTTTNGKNVGMESIEKTIGNYIYELTPITFYSQNAKGFRDYANGFTPDVECDEEDYYYGDWGTTDDMLFYYAMKWITSGSKPSTAISRSGSRPQFLKLNNQRSVVRRHGAVTFPGRFN